MVELNEKTQQDFLNREWIQKFLDAGVDMSDAKYIIGEYIGKDWIEPKDEDMEYDPLRSLWSNILPTYTVSELLYKLHEWIYPTIDGEEYSGGLKLIKDAPFYIAYYDLHEAKKMADSYIYAEFEYPIESLASLLIQCHKKDIGMATKDTGNISSK